ncbi:hypothetical protein M758_4G054000 [Ceratodon purpureus]|uniref:Galactose oxidase n=1 Tax=Ceratodon purpureus TaxID=3225 RepID=A0A8T0I5Q3_CERPU|nr:hypothetical protein KC19_4G064500 [Ceratodon purpureus]KAG0578991.1 hypothetical protein KC19_4G064500 [Ceratodon purpureus]KAG0618313.1 hypothetical protein M758_4G054000 [Ceratodon purpureus]KAG0618314.1 hypothetical protein M758_4G054000 [Ceratodon purpureus]
MTNVRFLPMLVFLLLTMLLADSIVTVTEAAQDSWKTVVQNAGVEAMHMATFHTDKVVIFDRTNVGATGMKMQNGRCRDNSKDLVLKHDCWAHSVEYDSTNNRIRTLFIFTDPFCSSGAFLPDGTLQQTGGDKEGAWNIRQLGAGPNDDWRETNNFLFKRRWYATNQILPDGRIIIIGGTMQPSYEFVPHQGKAAIPLAILSKAFAPKPEGENNIYPFVHLLPDGNLFIFANVYSTVFNYKTNRVVKNLPDLGRDPRVYPYSGTSTLLPLSPADGYRAIVFICGGGPLGAYGKAKGRNYLTALDTCGRIEPLAANAKWSVEKMPGPRVMVDGVILPTGEFLYVNGMQAGVLGWNQNRNPALAPYLYNPTTKRFTVQTATNIVRAYHSAANLQSDGTVLIAGGNDQSQYVFSGVRWPTELRIQKYSPYYLNAAYNNVRFTIVGLPGTAKLNSNFGVTFQSGPTPTKVQISLYAPPFVTHGNSMNQRMVILKQVGGITKAGAAYVVTVTAPPNGNIAPPGYYMCTALNTGTNPAIPSKARWIKITN